TNAKNSATASRLIKEALGAGVIGLRSIPPSATSNATNKYDSLVVFEPSNTTQTRSKPHDPQHIHLAR
ncbi:MAG: hypothetical protein WEK74_03055, partial [Hydrogenophaga sp.]